MGIVAISATQPAAEAANTFFKKNLMADSPSALCDYIYEINLKLIKYRRH